MALCFSPLQQRPCHLLRLRGGVGREAPSPPRAISFATGTELPRLPGSRGGGCGCGGGSNMSKYANNPTKYWEQFYRRHDNKFFKDRHYLEKDWGSYFAVGKDKDGTFAESKVVLEVGCGAGNSLFPLLDAFPTIFLHACDISPHAISLIKSNGAFRHERMNAFVCDITHDNLCKKINQSSVDIVTMIFMLSAVSPIKMPRVLQNIKHVLKPSGCILFRDYAAGDFSQGKLAIKNQMISENFYARGDGTCVFYFSEDSLSRLFRENGFSTLEVSVCSRQIENRSRKIVMDRENEFYDANHPSVGFVPYSISKTVSLSNVWCVRPPVSYRIPRGKWPVNN